MNTAGYRSPRDHDPQDVGTLWTMRRSGHSARCALIARRGHWELRVLIDRDLLLEERFDGVPDAFSVAGRWKEQMLLDGWKQVVPSQNR
jgi:hypothetical protein